MADTKWHTSNVTGGTTSAGAPGGSQPIKAGYLTKMVCLGFWAVGLEFGRSSEILLLFPGRSS